MISCNHPPLERLHCTVSFVLCLIVAEGKPLADSHVAIPELFEHRLELVRLGVRGKATCDERGERDKSGVFLLHRRLHTQHLMFEG